MCPVRSVTYVSGRSVDSVDSILAVSASFLIPNSEFFVLVVSYAAATRWQGWLN
jgi:hypothetical protein